MLCYTVNRLQYSTHIAFISTWKPKTYVTIAYSVYCMVWNWTCSVSEICLYVSNEQVEFEFKKCNTIYISTPPSEILRYKSNKIHTRSLRRKWQNSEKLANCKMPLFSVLSTWPTSPSLCLILSRRHSHPHTIHSGHVQLTPRPESVYHVLCVYAFAHTILICSHQWWLLWHIISILDAQSCPTLCDTMDCSLPGSSVCGILQKE